MTLEQIRKRAVEISGRYDLVMDYPLNLADKGIDAFIISGLDFLDGYGDITGTRTGVSWTLPAGQDRNSVLGLRTIESVVRVSGQDRIPLAPVLPYASMPGWDRTQGVPCYYTIPAYLFSTNILEVQVYPIPAEETEFEVFGRRKSILPAEASGTTFWFTHYSYLSIYATLAAIEETYRNSQGTRDWYNAIMMRLKQLDQDQAETQGYTGMKLPNAF